MKKFSSNEIRQIWLNFFASKNHKIIESAPLVPINDPSLLWINAGVAPLKKYFDGREIPENRRMVNAQKSIRTNDIENVGKTARHHTFFEMLGNFSIGDYFRDEALEWAMEILTSPKYFGFDLNKLYFTVHPDDDESLQKWLTLGVKRDHIFPIEGNFWEIGEGPCGPNTEVFYDRGEKYDPQKLGTVLLANDIENDRYIEIWNIVFSQYNAVAGVPRSEYQELPSKNIDTGMGLERMACVIQEVETNYDTDLFTPIIQATEEITKVDYQGQMAFKVIADHVRSVVFAVADGAMISNEGRGYVLRRILRRAVRYGKKLGMNEAFLYRLVKVVANTMESFYPYLQDKVDDIAKLIKQEEEKFLLTLETGEKKLLDYVNNSLDKVIAGKDAFLLYDTFGFPIELTLELAEEYGFQVDLEGFQDELRRQKELSRSARSDDNSMISQNEDMINFHEESSFVGYEQLIVSTEVVGLFKEGKLVSEASGDCLVVFKTTPFYAEAGGQVGDIGSARINNQEYPITLTTKLPNNQHASMVKLKNQTLRVGDLVEVCVNSDYRSRVVKNHSATHLLNESLRRIVGKHIYQQGSFVGDEGLRFDFNHYRLLTNEEILRVEALVNQEIKKATPVVIKEMPMMEAKAMDVQAVFGEKYGEVVRVVNMDFSKELCGGCHVDNTKEIEQFAIVSIESKGSGIYRIEAATSNNISNELNRVLENINKEITDLKNKAIVILEEAKAEGITLDYQEIKLSPQLNSYQMVINRREELNALREQVKELDKKLAKNKKEKNIINLDDYLKNNLTINGYNVLICKTFDIENELMKDLMDRLADHLGSSVVFLANVINDKVIYMCKNKIDSLHAGNLVKAAAIISAGNGGGRNDFAQAGGRDLSKIDEALTKVMSLIESKL